MLPIAINTLKEFVRNKIFYIILSLAFVLILFSIVLVQLTITETSKVFIDTSLSVIEIFALITTLFLGSYLIYNEIQKNTVLMILSKNPNRSDFIIGKFLGFSIVLLILYLILTLAFILTGLFLKFKMNIKIDLLNIYYYIAIYFSFLKMLIILWFLIFFSTFVSPFVALLSSLAIYIISHSLAFVKFYLIAAKKISEGSFLYKLIDLLYYIFPNFQDLSLKEYLLSPFLWDYNLYHVIISSLASFWYIIILLSLAVFIFNRKEF